VPDVILAAAILIELAAPEMVLFVRVSTVARPTSVSVASGMVIDWFALCWKTSVVLKPVVAGAILNLRSFVESLELTKLVVKSDNVLFVSVSVDVREIIVSFATGFGKVSVLAAKVFTDANVSVPAEANDRSNLSCPTPEIVVVASVRVLLVSVSVVARPTKVSVEVGRVSVPVLTMDAITGAVSVLLVSVSVVARPTRVSVEVGSVRVPVLTIDENDGVMSVGDVPNTSSPVPVSSEIIPLSCADVVAANWLSGFPVSAAADADHDKLPSVSPKRHPLATVLAAVGRMRL
jgi:hypothetical protein